MIGNERFDRICTSLQSSSKIFLRYSLNTSKALQLQDHIDRNATPSKEDRASKVIECQTEVRLNPSINVGCSFSGDTRGRSRLTKSLLLIGGFSVDSK